ncbi:MAG: hypothetical protein ACRCZI_05620 [Cetobacterium sp.]
MFGIAGTEVGAGGVRDGVAEGASKGHKECSLGGSSLIADTHPPARDRVLGDLQREGGKGGDVAKVCQELRGGCGDGTEEWGVPVVQRVGVVGVVSGIVAVVDIRCEEMLDGGLGAGCEEKELGVAVLKGSAKFAQVGGVGGGSLLEVLMSELSRANRLTKIADAGGNFRVRATRVLELHVVQSLDQSNGMRGARLVADRDARCGRKELGFGVVQVKTKGATNAFKRLEERDDIKGVEE